MRPNPRDLIVVSRRVAPPTFGMRGSSVYAHALRASSRHKDRLYAYSVFLRIGIRFKVQVKDGGGGGKGGERGRGSGIEGLQVGNRSDSFISGHAIIDGMSARTMRVFSRIMDVFSRIG